MTPADLVARLEKASGPDRELDGWIALSAGWTKVYRDWDYVTNYGSPHWEWFDPKGQSNQKIPAYTESMDAALALVPPNHLWTIYSEEVFEDGDVRRPSAAVHFFGDRKYTIGDETQAATPAIALTIAALKAMTQRREG